MRLIIQQNKNVYAQDGPIPKTQLDKPKRVLDIKRQHIMKTYQYNFEPLKPQFYIVKLGFTGVYIVFLISAQNIDWGSR